MPPLLLHVDGAAGISGDMTLGALVDLGVSVDQLREGLATLPIGGWRLSAERVVQRGFAATKVHVDVEGDDDVDGARPARVQDVVHPHPTPHAHGPTSATEGHSHGATSAMHAHGDARHHRHDEPHHHGHDDDHGRTFADLARIVDTSRLPSRVKERATAVFRCLCEAEARVHGASLETAHLHEAGAIDALVDVCGSCLGLELLGWPELSCSPPDVGGGTIRCRHGVLPVPAPATIEILKGMPTRSSGVEAELVTPTGAALLATLSTRWGAQPAMRVLKVGIGAGTRALPDRANVVRFALGEALEAGTTTGSTPAGDARLQLEADLDDANPQLVAAACARLVEAGAVDVTQSALVMKKGRAGVRLTVLCTESSREGVVDALFRETTTIGCRWHEVRRAECERRLAIVGTPFGPIRVKLALWNGRIVNRKPEHEDCVAAAARAGVPLKDVALAASAASLSLGLEDQVK